MTYLPPSDPRAAAPGPSRDTVGAGERTAWLVPTAVLGGIGALLLLGGGGAAMAASLSVEQRTIDATVAEAVDTVVVDGHSAVVEVVTADVPDLRVEAVYAGIGLDRAPEPRVQDGRLTVDALPSGRWPGTGTGMQVTVTVPAGDEPVDLRLSSDAGTLRVDGDFGDVGVTTDAGVVQVSGSARSLSAVSQVGTVLAEDVRVREDLDVHTEFGATEVEVLGDAPRRSSVTTRTGAIEAALPEANYWRPTVAGADDRDPEELTTATVCAAAPAERPCLYVSSAVGAVELTQGDRSPAAGGE
ncbi:hypothetical protein [Kocuria sp.]|jgi:hypothetical protein|uniref:hypothetical protein n=1 Tax=Kocuria sp. TaxID=1871328 RepID=UPI002810E96E|nr:hypothetical protein [Kocuria sp.]HST72000.1 hypothetical protein [Kocuria rosea]